MKHKLSVHKATWATDVPFRITGFVFEKSEALVVEIGDGHHVGRGEGIGVFYLDDTIDKMYAKAARAGQYPILKVKLDSVEPVERMEAIRAVRPDATLVIDANQGFDLDQLTEVLPHFVDSGVAMLEQPLARGEDEGLASISTSIPICADEICLHSAELERAQGSTT